MNSGSDTDTLATVRALDASSSVIYLYVPPQNVVLFQAFIELYEGLAAVRTVDREGSVVCLMVCNDMLDDLKQLLSALKPELEWRNVEQPAGQSWEPL